MNVVELQNIVMPLLIARFPELNNESFQFVRQYENSFYAPVKDIPNFIQATLFKNIGIFAWISNDGTYIQLKWSYNHPCGSNGYSFGIVAKHNGNWRLAINGEYD